MSTLEVNKITPVGVGTSVTLGDSGDTFTIPSGVTLTNNGTVTGIGGENTPNFYVRLSSNFDLVNDTFVKVPWDSEQFDSDNAFASNKFTVPSGKGGKYFFLVHAFLGNQLGRYTITLYKNGSILDPRSQWSHVNRNTSDADMSQGLWQIVDLSAGDYIEVYVQTTAGSNGDVLSSTSFFQGFKLIGS